MSISSTELRKRFLSFFENKGHKIVPSSPLLPKDDPTLLFVNAGMVQFKDVFTGKERRPYARAASSQKCVRAGGKHNDLENVGRTARHHTFFEMLGNFSFGDYFKEDACLFAWDFLTKELGLDASKLSVTIFGGEGPLPADEDAERIWRDIVGVPSHAISRKGADDNFWAMGDTGPCGPCTEIHYERGDMTANFGGDDSEGDRNMEVWNLVFMQYDKKPDGFLVPLPAPSVDTGMGLERLCTVVNQLSSSYESDLLKPLVEATAQKSGKAYQGRDNDDDVSIRVIADHSRATAFLLADGLFPSNEGRGYVLRRIMRRAIRHGAKLGFDKPFFHEICDLVVELFAKIYPELKQIRALISKVVLQEEESFRRTLHRGLNLFADVSSHLKKGDPLDGAIVFRLYETYGFPPDLTEVLAEEKGLQINWEHFKEAKLTHEKASSSELGLNSIADIYKELRDLLGGTRFIGETEVKGTGKIVAILKNKAQVKQLKAGESGELFFDQTPFYGESGGQIGDTGSVASDRSFAEVSETKKIADLHVHIVNVDKGTFSVGDACTLEINKSSREAIKRHHSVTHLLHSALRTVLGNHVTQKGSLVAIDRLRFDFSHFESVTEEQINKVEDLVNAWILENNDTHAKQMSLDEAKNHGAMALFGEKYGDQVRVIEIGPNSTELCGGTHVHHTGDIGSFRITSEGPLAAGIRRIEAVAGLAAIQHTRKERDYLHRLSALLSSPLSGLEERVQRLLSELKDTQKQIGLLQSKDMSDHAGQVAQNAISINGIKVISERNDNLDSKSLQLYADKLRNHLQSGIVVLGSASSSDKCSILVAVTKDLSSKYHAGKMVGELAQIIGGKGGGRPDFAQAGGTKSENLDEALKHTGQLIINMF
jgi:alanyl-tRNA synthetase